MGVFRVAWWERWGDAWGLGDLEAKAGLSALSGQRAWDK